MTESKEDEQCPLTRCTHRRRGKAKQRAAPERFVFVRDGFHVWAFLLAPLWLLAHRLWLAFIIYVVGYGLLGVHFSLAARAGDARNCWSACADRIAGRLRGAQHPALDIDAARLDELGFVVGEDAEMAERRFFDIGTSAAAAAPLPGQHRPRQLLPPVRRGPPSPSDIIGLFPEPGGQR